MKESANRDYMADNDVLSNQHSILENQKSILANQTQIQENQKAILANQEQIQDNQKALQQILRNQETILSLIKK